MILERHEYMIGKIIKQTKVLSGQMLAWWNEKN